MCWFHVDVAGLRYVPTNTMQCLAYVENKFKPLWFVCSDLFVFVITELKSCYQNIMFYVVPTIYSRILIAKMCLIRLGFKRLLSIHL